MRLPSSKIETEWARDTGVRPLVATDLLEARNVFGLAFDADVDQAESMIPDSITNSDHSMAWGLYVDGELRSLVVTSDIEDATVIWSMSTPPRYQHHGYGRRLLTAVMARKRGSGAEDFLLFASAAGAPLYGSLGFDLLEHWQEWSRPRWVFGRS
jgi:GNAT superfamily N-acetyltransferase